MPATLAEQQEKQRQAANPGVNVAANKTANKTATSENGEFINMRVSRGKNGAVIVKELPPGTCSPSATPAPSSTPGGPNAAPGADPGATPGGPNAAPGVKSGAPGGPNAAPGVESGAPAVKPGLTTPVVTRVPQASPNTNLDGLAKESINNWTPDQKIKLLTDIPALNWPESARSSYRPALNDSKRKNKEGKPITDSTEILKHKIRENFAKMINVPSEKLADIPVKLAGERDSEKLPNLNHALLEGTPIYPFINTSDSAKRYEALKSMYKALGMSSELVNEFPYKTSGGSRKKRMHSQRKRRYTQPKRKGSKRSGYKRSGYKRSGYKRSNSKRSNSKRSTKRSTKRSNSKRSRTKHRHSKRSYKRSTRR